MYFTLNGERAAYIDNLNRYAITESGRLWVARTQSYRIFPISRLYPNINIQVNGKKQTYRIHRLVAEYFLEPVEGCNVVDHIDNNPQNNHYLNLRWTNFIGNCNNRYDQKKEMCVRKLARKNVYNVFLGRYSSKAEAEEVLRKALIGLAG